MSRTLKVAWGSLGVSVVALAMKFAAYWLTGSVALYSDALETVINVMAALGALVALWFSGRPADANHPYGHHKAEYLSAVAEGALVLATAFLIGREAWLAWAHPRAPETPFLGILLNGAAGAVNLAWALVLIRGGRRWKSPALVAGGKHLMTDVWTTGAVLAGFALVPLTGWLRLDPLVAALVALNILWTGYGVLRESVGGLMDEVADPEAVAELRRVIAAHADGALEAHDVRTRTAGRVTFVEFHLVVPGRMTVEDAHAICDRIERALRERAGQAVIHIHVEPEHKPSAVAPPWWAEGLWSAPQRHHLCPGSRGRLSDMRQQGEVPGAALVTRGAAIATGPSRRSRAPDPHIEPAPPPGAAGGGAMERRCVERGLKMTGQRRVIARVLSEASDHPDVEELYRRAALLDGRISIATVYRTVRLLEERGILQRRDFGSGRARYEPADHGHHYHLIDVETGKVVEFRNSEHERLVRALVEQLGFEVVSLRLEVFGRRLEAPPGPAAVGDRTNGEAR